MKYKNWKRLCNFISCIMVVSYLTGCYVDPIWWGILLCGIITVLGLIIVYGMKYGYISGCNFPEGDFGNSRIHN